MCVCVCSASKSCLTLLRPHGLQSTRLPCSWDYPGRNAGVGSYFLLQGIFLTQGSNSSLLSLLHWQVDSLPPAPPGKRRTKSVFAAAICGAFRLRAISSCTFPALQDWGRQQASFTSEECNSFSLFLFRSFKHFLKFLLTMKMKPRKQIIARI